MAEVKPLGKFPDRRPFRVALTIDTELRGRPADPGNATRVVDALDAARVTATFFVQGRWAGGEPALLRRIHDAGHLIGNHSYYHAPMDLLTDAGITDSVTRAHRTILAVAGVDARPWFRCPYGVGHDDPRVLRGLAAQGYRDVTWDVDGEDWADGRDAGDLAATIVAGALDRGDGARVLLHSWPDATAAALPGILDALRESGAAMVRLDELGEAAFGPADPPAGPGGRP